MRKTRAAALDVDGLEVMVLLVLLIPIRKQILSETSSSSGPLLLPEAETDGNRLLNKCKTQELPNESNHWFIKSFYLCAK